MELDELVNEREADSRSLVASALNAFDAVEAFEDTRQLVFGNAGSGIFHFEQRPLVPCRNRHDDAPLQGELERVRNKVEDDLLPHVAIDMDGPGIVVAVDLEVEPRPFHGRSERAGQIRRDGAEIDRLEPRAHASRFDS